MTERLVMPMFDNAPTGSLPPSWFIDVLSHGQSVTEAFGCDWQIRSHVKESIAFTVKAAVVLRSMTSDTLTTVVEFDGVKPRSRRRLYKNAPVNITRCHSSRSGHSSSCTRVSHRVRAFTVISDTGGKPLLSADGREFFLAELAVGSIEAHYQSGLAPRPACIERKVRLASWMSCCVDTDLRIVSPRGLWHAPSNSVSSPASNALFTYQVLQSQPDVVGYIRRAEADPRLGRDAVFDERLHDTSLTCII